VTFVNPQWAKGTAIVARVVLDWIATIERLWDDSEFEARHRALALAEGRRWDAERLGERYERFFGYNLRLGS